MLRRNPNQIRDMDRSDLEKHVLGKRVTEVNTERNTITLDDGTVLEFEGASECCAWFAANLKAGELTDNMVTAVREEEAECPDARESWSLHILAGDTRLASVDICGDSSNGYYCHSIILNISKPSTE